LPHISLGEGAGPLKVSRFVGQAMLHAGETELKDVTMDSLSGKFQVSGTASPRGELDFRLGARNPSGTAPGFAISGTLAEPRVEQLTGPETQARLKP
jgi:hypothetical protein